jgi:hypothetical protein
VRTPPCSRRIKSLKDPAEKTAALKKLAEQTWRVTCFQIAAEYDLGYLGGWNYVKEYNRPKRGALEARFRMLLERLLPANILSGTKTSSYNLTGMVFERVANEVVDESAVVRTGWEDREANEQELPESQDNMGDEGDVERAGDAAYEDLA